MIERIGVWVHMVTRCHRPVWRWYQISEWADWRACSVCQDRRRGL